MPQRAIGVTDETPGASVAEFRLRERAVPAFLLGRREVGTSSDFSASGNTAAWPFVAARSGELKYIWARTLSTNTASAVRFGIYADSSGAPGARLGVANVDSLTVANSVDAARATLASTVTITAGTTYWLAWHSAGDARNFWGASGGSYREVTADFPDPFGTTTTSTVDAAIWGEAEETMGEQYLITTPERVHSGAYAANTGLHQLNVTPHSSGVGFWYLVNPSGSSVSVALRYLLYTIGTTSNSIAFANSPRTTLDRFTFTGTPSGTNIASETPADSAQPAPTAILVSTATGMTITPGEIVKAFLAFPGFSGGATSGAGAMQRIPSFLRDYPSGSRFPTWGDPSTIVLAPGEGIMFRQLDAGATSESTSRTITTNIVWDEYTLP